MFRGGRRDASRLYDITEIAFAVGGTNRYEIHALAGIIPRLQPGRGYAVFVLIEVWHERKYFQVNTDVIKSKDLAPLVIMTFKITLANPKTKSNFAVNQVATVQSYLTQIPMHAQHTGMV